jgi:hypothetical protein
MTVFNAKIDTWIAAQTKTARDTAAIQ